MFALIPEDTSSGTKPLLRLLNLALVKQVSFVSFFTTFCIILSFVRNSRKLFLQCILFMVSIKRSSFSIIVPMFWFRPIAECSWGGGGEGGTVLSDW